MKENSSYLKAIEPLDLNIQAARDGQMYIIQILSY